jgi:aminopeptidase N
MMKLCTLCVIALFLVNCAATNPPLHPVTATSSGALSSLQADYDVKHYSLAIELDPKQRTIKGDVGMTATALAELETIDLDFDPRFRIHAAYVNGAAVNYESRGGKLFLMTAAIPAGALFTTQVVYSGRPYEAENPPWDGGFVWRQTASGEPWIATAVQGRGCDLYWPCKDHISDKPERGADMRITVPAGLTAVMNGVLVETDEVAGKTTFHWRTSNPISAYHLAINVGPFQTYELPYESILGNGLIIPVVYYHISTDMEKIDGLIRDDFLKQLAFYERTLGPYPWGNEKIGIVEIPYLGMEHQTMNGYGNEYRLDPDGFDWLIQHEFAHEWFGNLMTQAGSRDFWLHEGFANYMQPIYAQEVIGDAAFWSKMWDNYNATKNCKPVVPAGQVDMDYFDSNDPYFKGSWTLHTLRWMMGEDKFWQAVRRLIYDTPDPWSLEYPIAPTSRSTEDFVRIASEEYGEDLAAFFDATIYAADQPVLAQTRSATGLSLAFSNNPELSINIPVKVTLGGQSSMIVVPSNGIEVSIPVAAKIQVDPEVKIFRDFGTIARCEAP